MPASFNLIDHPFLPCTALEGTSGLCSLRDVLLHAHTLAELHDESPLVTVAAHRLLLAILHRCYQGPKRASDRVALWKAARFDADRINDYLDKWHDRFDLFHEQHPFYQTVGFTTNDPSGINRLAQELSRGNNAALFDHTTDDPPPALTPAHAARVLIAEQAFAVGGGKSETGNTTHAPLVAGAVVLARGNTLFETLWLNLTVFSDREPVASLREDAPVWERDPVAPHTLPSRPRGYLDYLTWQSRTLRLHPEEAEGKVVVSRVSYAQGRKLEVPAGFQDPLMAFSRRDTKDPFLPVRFNEARDLWRDSAALFQMQEEGDAYGRAPTCLRTLAAFELKEILPRSRRYRVSVLGLCSDKAKVLFWRHETLPLPLAYLDHPELVEALRMALSLAEAVGSEALRRAAWAAAATRLTANPDMKPDTTRVRHLIDSFAPERLYWSRLEGPFRHLLVALAEEGADRAAAVQDWFANTLVPTVRNAYDQSIGRIDAGRDLKAVQAGWRVLAIQLAKIRRVHHLSHPQQEELV